VKTIAVADGMGGEGSPGGGGLVEAQKEVAREVRRVIGSAVWERGGVEGES